MSSRQSISDRHSTRSASSTKKRPSKALTKKRLSSITENEEIDSFQIVQPIMEEILETALKEIHIKYMEEQTIKFVVHCAHEALVKFLRFYFYQHNDYLRKPEFWRPDQRVEPSHPDSWAIGQVPVYKDIPSETELNTLSAIELDIAEKGTPMVDDSRADVISEPSLGLLSDIKECLNSVIDTLPLEQIEAAKLEAASEISEFSCVVEGRKHYNEFKMKPQISKITIGPSTTLKLPPIALKEPEIPKKQSNESSIAEPERLPPIKIDAKYKCHSASGDKIQAKKIWKKP